MFLNTTYRGRRRVVKLYLKSALAAGKRKEKEKSIYSTNSTDVSGEYREQRREREKEYTELQGTHIRVAQCTEFKHQATVQAPPPPLPRAHLPPAISPTLRRVGGVGELTG
jgi:hypothetical protein